MRKLIVSDERETVAIIAIGNQSLTIKFAISELFQKDVQRWLDRGFTGYDLENHQSYPVKPQDTDFLEQVEKRLKQYGFKTQYDSSS